MMEVSIPSFDPKSLSELAAMAKSENDVEFEAIVCELNLNCKSSMFPITS